MNHSRLNKLEEKIRKPCGCHRRQDPETGWIAISGQGAKGCLYVPSIQTPEQWIQARNTPPNTAQEAF